MLRLFDCKKIFLLTAMFILLLTIPATSWADTDIKITVSDPTSNGNVKYEGTTVNTVLDIPTVSFGENRMLGTLRITGKEGLEQPVRPGNKIMMTLPVGLSYMQVPTTENYRNYVEWPESLDGVKNQICDSNDKPGIKFISGTPSSITLEVNNVEGSGKTVLDFVFNKENFSTVRVAKIIKSVEDYRAQPDENVTRIEFIKLLADVTVPFSPVFNLEEDEKPLNQRFTDLPNLTPEERYQVKMLANYGILAGYPGGLLKPEEHITRAQAVALIGKFYLSAENKVNFKDTIPEWAKESINAAASNGIVSGYHDGTFKPNQLVTKSEVMSILQRTLESYSTPKSVNE